MATQFTAEQPLPWCATCEVHHVLNAGDQCPSCGGTDGPTVRVEALPPVPAPRHPAWIEKLLRGNRPAGDGRG